MNHRQHILPQLERFLANHLTPHKLARPPAAASRWSGLETLESRAMLSAAPFPIDSPIVGGFGYSLAAPAAPVSTLSNSSASGDLASAFDTFYLPPQRHLIQSGAFLTPPSTSAPLDIARAYLAAHVANLGLTISDLRDAAITDQYTDESTGVTHIYLRQTSGGLEVMNADLNINVTASGQVINVGTTFVADVNSAAASLSAPSITAPQAYDALNDALDLGLLTTPRIVSQLTGSPAADTVLSASGASLADVPASLVYVPTPTGLELAWRLNVQTTDRAHWYDAYVAADDGQPIYAADWVEHATYNVFPLPVESPSTGSRALVTDPQDPLASPYGWHDTDGIPGAEFTDTQGNNVSAQEDQDANNTGGTRPSGGANLNFDFPLNLAQDPTLNQSASLTNLFYWTNLLHDIHYHYGFTEEAGNFQVNDYGRGGIGGDPVIADAHDSASTNNAHMATPPDGQSPRMEMYLWNYTNPRRDPDFDSQIIIHEYGHGVSRRLTGGPANSNSLDAVQSAGMNEGWSDWWALMLTQLPTDGKLDPFPIATYSYGQSPTSGGIRRYPYSFNMAVNPLTLSNFNGGNANNESHRAGEIWCSALWDLNWLLIDKYGYSSDLVAGTAGNNLALQLVMDAEKLQPANPSFLAGRDAILAADMVRTGGQNQSEIWTAFARRGMGYSASDGGNSNATVVVAAFDLPPNASITGNVFRDDDASGTRNGAEPGLAGWTVYRDSNNNGTLDLVTTTTFNSTDTPRAIPDPGTTYSNLTIAGYYGTVTDVNVTVNLSHPVDGQLYVSLISPGGIPVIMSNQQGGAGQNFTATTFDDEAATPISSGAAPFTGSYVPYMALSRVDGVNPNGAWQLRLDDLVSGQSGTLLSWSMQITYAGGEPSTITDANGNYTFSTLSNGPYHIREVTQSGFSVTAPASGVHDVTIAAGQPVVGRNFGNQSTLASATPGVPDLLDASDTGSNPADNLTKLDNAAPANVLQFSVPNTIAGAQVKLYADGVLIGSATAAGSTTTIITTGAFALTDGLHQLTARQIEPGLGQSLASSALAIQVDTQAPAVTVNQHTIQTDPSTSANIYFTAVFSETVTGFTLTDVTIGGTAGATTGFLGSGTSTYDFLLSGMTSSGTVIATIPAGVATDAAGNPNLASTSTDNTVTYNLPAPEIAVTGLSQNITDGDSTPAASDGTDFGAVSVGNPVVTRTFTVTNTGAAPLTLGAVSVPSGFALGSDALVTSLAPGISDTFTVTLSTSTIGAFAGDVSLSTNDSDENPFNFRITGVVNALTNNPPVIASLTDSPDPVLLGSTLTLTASGVTDPDPGDVVLAVQFIRDVNANGVVDASDIVLGTDYDGTNGWSWTGPTTGFPLGANRYLAQAYAGSLLSAPASTTGVVNPVNPPLVGALAVSATSLTRPANLTLTASSVSDPSGFGITAVEFYRDSNANGLLDPATDQLLRSDTNAADGWTWTGPTLGFDVGANRYFARAQSTPGLWSAAATKTNTINNALPTIASLAVSPSIVTFGGNQTLTAGAVADADGSVARVEFYRDVNANYALDATDELLGVDADSAGGWTLTTSTAAFPPGTVRYLARAQDNNNAWSAIRTGSGTVNLPPALSAIALSRDPVHKGDNLTITASGVTDAAPGYISSVEFYRDANNNSIIDAADVSLGSDTTPADGWFKSVSTSAFPLGNVQILARAKDNSGAYSPVVGRSVLVNAKPVIGTLTDSPDPVVQGQNLTLTATSVTDADGSIARVEFYRDANNNSTLDAADEFLGADTDGSNGWFWTGSTAAFPVGTVRYLAQAQDNRGAWSALKSTTGIVNQLPLIATLTAAPDPVHKGDTLTVTAASVSDPNGYVSSVTFYRDTNNNGIWDAADTTLGTDSNAADGWILNTSTSSFPLGAVRLFARARDNHSAYSLSAATTTVLVNNKPTIGTFTVSPTTVVQGASVTLTASTVADTDGSVSAVEFYLDRNGNSLIDPAIDLLIGAGVNTAAGIWKLTISSAPFPVGAARYLARAQDNRAAWSLGKVATGTVTAPPSPLVAPPPSPLLANSTPTTTATSSLVAAASQLSAHNLTAAAHPAAIPTPSNPAPYHKLMEWLAPANFTWRLLAISADPPNIRPPHP